MACSAPPSVPIKESSLLSRDTQIQPPLAMRLPPGSRALRYHSSISHPGLRHAPPVGTVGLRNRATSSPVQEKGDKVFGERFHATIGFITNADDTFPNEDFFPDVDDLFDDMGDNSKNGHAAASASVQYEMWDALEAKFGTSDVGTELYVMEQFYEYRMTDKARAKDTRARGADGSSSANLVHFQSHKFNNKNRFEGKGKFDVKNKASHSTNFKKKKRGVCHVCGDPVHWTPNCLNCFDKRQHGKSGKTNNIVIGDTEMKDARTKRTYISAGRAPPPRMFTSPLSPPFSPLLRSVPPRAAMVVAIAVTAAFLREGRMPPRSSHPRHLQHKLPLRRGGAAVASRMQVVFKKKLRPDGTIEKYKAWLVAKGYTQKEGTASYGIHYSGYPRLLEGYSDSNWISDADAIKAKSGALRRRSSLSNPGLRRAPPVGIVGLRNRAASSPVREKGDKVFGERFRATTGFITDADDTFPNDDFSPDVDDLFDDMGDNANNGHAAASASVQYVLISTMFRFMFQIMVQFLVLAFGVDMLSSNPLLHMDSEDRMIMETMEEEKDIDPYFKLKHDDVGTAEFLSIQKCTTAMRWSHDKMRQVIQAFVIMSNMIIEDDRKIWARTHVGPNEWQGPLPEVGHEVPADFANFLAMHAEIRDSNVHDQRQHDLVKHIWSVNGLSANVATP
ncbi:hypothetical protein QYE76_010079 [Lolium multiflorum]|uniref:Uncharacterized protein n=1 Tax=Lolium multiflorum TaxID=4521 RepID=A0AAD8TUW5_LOLMU|nr:hypothetical protein QYE76_010079 [Lolium multiflorum]